MTEEIDAARVGDGVFGVGGIVEVGAVVMCELDSMVGANVSPVTIMLADFCILCPD